MKQVSDMVEKFFEEFERGTNASGPELVESQYGDVFMFAGPQGVQAIKRDDFLKALPKRVGFFKTIGLTSSKIRALEETRLDDKYVMVKVYWEMRFEKAGGQPTVDEISATYLLYQQADGLRIVFQLDHQDLMKRVEELGLSPAKG
jgi:hypothetical protein